MPDESSAPQPTSTNYLRNIIVHGGEWFDCRVNVRGMSVTTFINGKQLNE